LAYSKKAALDVSINSIVVIVFAVTMLGLGLAFIKGYFGKATEQFNIDQVGQISDATPNNPLSLSREDLTVHKGKMNNFGVKFYNNKESTHKVSFGLQCISDTGPATGFTLVVSSQSVEVGQQKEFRPQLKVAPAMVSKEYVCTLSAVAVNPVDSSVTVLEDKQITVTVK